MPFHLQFNYISIKKIRILKNNKIIRRYPWIYNWAHIFVTFLVSYHVFLSTFGYSNLHLSLSLLLYRINQEFARREFAYQKTRFSPGLIARSHHQCVSRRPAECVALRWFCCSSPPAMRPRSWYFLLSQISSRLQPLVAVLIREKTFLFKF